MDTNSMPQPDLFIVADSDKYHRAHSEPLDTLRDAVLEFEWLRRCLIRWTENTPAKLRRQQVRNDSIIKNTVRQFRNARRRLQTLVALLTKRPDSKLAIN